MSRVFWATVPLVMIVIGWYLLFTPGLFRAALTDDTIRASQRAAQATAAARSAPQAAVDAQGQIAGIGPTQTAEAIRYPTARAQLLTATAKTPTPVP